MNFYLIAFLGIIVTMLAFRQSQISKELDDMRDALAAWESLWYHYQGETVPWEDTEFKKQLEEAGLNADIPRSL